MNISSRNVIELAVQPEVLINFINRLSNPTAILFRQMSSVVYLLIIAYDVTAWADSE